jgi:hypothetical protein
MILNKDSRTLPEQVRPCMEPYDHFEEANIGDCSNKHHVSQFKHYFYSGNSTSRLAWSILVTACPSPAVEFSSFG